jgi:amino acid transporter
LTAAFLGAAYWSSCVLELLAGRERLWSNARSTVPAVIVFTALTLIITLVHIDRLHFNAHEAVTRVGTWFWLAVYTIVPVIMSVFWLRQIRAPGGEPRREQQIPNGMRALLITLALVMVLFGIGMLLVPALMIALWPWTLTPLTGRAIGAWLVGLGLAVGNSVAENDLRRSRNVSVGAVVFCILQALALARYPGEVQWDGPKIWIYLLFLVTFFICALVGLALGQRRRT